MTTEYEYTVPAYAVVMLLPIEYGRIFVPEIRREICLKKWEKRQYGIFQQCSNCITDTCSSSWCRAWYLGAINLLEGYGNDNPGANAHVR